MKWLGKLVIISTILYMISIILLPVELKASEEKLQIDLTSLKSEYRFKEPIIIEIKLKNISEREVNVLKMLLPEGWLISITIKNTQGGIVYTSRSVAIEMTAAMLETVFLEPGYFMGTSFKIDEPISPGEYTIDVVYSTDHLATRPNLNIPIGSWQSNIVRIKVLKGE